MAKTPDQQLKWNTYIGFSQGWGTNCYQFKPDHDYTAQRIGVALTRLLDERRGPGEIRFEKVTDPSLPGELINVWTWHTDELGPKDHPRWIIRSLPPYQMKKDQLYRIAVYTTPGWEGYHRTKELWYADEGLAAICWWGITGVEVFPRGEIWSGYNFRDNKGKWSPGPGGDYAFLVGEEEYASYELAIKITPEGAGGVEVSPYQGPYDPGEEVTLTAVPVGDNEFLSWSGDASGEDPTIKIVMDSDKTVMANFQESDVPDIPIVGDIIAWLKAKLQGLWDWLGDAFAGVYEGIKETVLGVLTTIAAPITTALEWVKEKLLDAWSWVTEAIPTALEWVKTKLLDMWNWLSTTIPETLTWISSRVDSLFGRVEELTTSVGGIGKSILETVARVLGSFFDPVCDNVNLIFKGIEPDLAPALAYNTPEVREEVMSWYPRGTVVYDYINMAIKFILHLPRILFDGLGGGFAKIFGEDPTEWMKRWNNNFATIMDNSETLPEYINEEIVEPMKSGIGDLVSKLAGILKDAFDKVWDAIKTFFTETLPNWFKGLWEKLKAGITWVWDKVSEGVEWFIDEIMDLLKIHSPISPEGGLGTLKGAGKIALAMAGGLGLMTVAGHLVHPLHSLGLEHISAMVYDMTNYKVLIGAGMGVIAATSIRYPMTWYLNATLRPMIPSERDAAMMRSRQYIPAETYSQLLAYRGIPDLWHEHLDHLTETRVGYFALAGIARCGVFDRELFYRDLHRAGYAEEIIGPLLTMFDKLASEAVQGMMSGAAVKRYKEGLTTDDQFFFELELLGYDKSQHPRFLAAAKLDYAYDFIMDLISAYRDAVRKGHISIDEYRGKLLDLNIVPERVEGYVLKERARLKPDEPLGPTGPPKPVYETDAGKVMVDTLRRQRRKNILSRDQEIAGLIGLGMPTDYASALADNDDTRLAEKVVEE